MCNHLKSIHRLEYLVPYRVSEMWRELNKHLFNKLNINMNNELTDLFEQTMPQFAGNTFYSEPNVEHSVSTSKAFPSLLSYPRENPIVATGSSLLIFSRNESRNHVLRLRGSSLRRVHHIRLLLPLSVGLPCSAPELSWQFVCRLPAFCFIVHYGIVSFIAYRYHFFLQYHSWYIPMYWCVSSWIKTLSESLFQNVNW